MDHGDREVYIPGLGSGPKNPCSCGVSIRYTHTWFMKSTYYRALYKLKTFKKNQVLKVYKVKFLRVGGERGRSAISVC